MSAFWKALFGEGTTGTDHLRMSKRPGEGRRKDIPATKSNRSEGVGCRHSTTEVGNSKHLWPGIIRAKTYEEESGGRVAASLYWLLSARLRS